MGAKPLSAETLRSLRRKNANSTRAYTLNGSVTTVYKTLIDSFTKSDFETYEYYYKKWGSPGRKCPALVEAMEKRQVLGPPLELAKLRLENAYTHQKVWQCIRYRWTNLYSYRQTRINLNQDSVWIKLARGVFNRMQEIPRLHSSEWGNTKDEVIESLVICFKQKFEKQNKLCAISKVPLELAIGPDVENKCSIDRIDSAKPYTKKNIQLVAFWANVMKLDAPLDQFLERIEIIHKANHA